ncbi:MAG: sigma-70 family RNA polymerase sigma factor [Erysipelotrichaceae bacterium]|nr:sigma-70 family RNA polymerase sigma factor [Erysipelotrichaceae bacterium]
MEDFEIVELYWDRDENAITQTDRKYGKYCRKIAFSIVNDREDTEECVNDTYLQTWNSLPPQRPEKLSTYLGKICRNISINLYEKLTAEKRGGNETDACLDEISELVGGSSEVEEQLDLTVLTDLINKFLKRCEKQARTVFVQRYWYMMSVKEIARENRMSDSNVKMTLSRTREKLKLYLEEEGYSI